MLSARLTPKASRDEVIGVESFDGAPVPKARVRALPEGGCANAALEKLIARWLGVPPMVIRFSMRTDKCIPSGATILATKHIIGDIA